MPPKHVPTPGDGNRLNQNVAAPEEEELPAPPAPARAYAPRSQPVERAPQPAKEPRRRKREGGGPGTTTVYVSEALFARAEAYRRKKSGRRNLDILFEALEKHLAELPGIIERSKVSTGQASSLFGVDPRQVRYVGGGGTQWQFTPLEAQDKLLDQIAERLGFTTRSTWIPPLLNEFLPGKKEKAPARAEVTPIDLDALWATPKEDAPGSDSRDRQDAGAGH